MYFLRGPCQDATSKRSPLVPVEDLFMLKGNQSFKFRAYTIIHRNYAGNKHKSFKIMKTHIFEILDKAKPYTKNIRGLNLAVVKHMTVKVIKIPL
jgi:hypothetical protein